MAGSSTATIVELGAADPVLPPAAADWNGERDRSIGKFETRRQRDEAFSERIEAY